jgi:lipoprotein-releasing system ATP-binding protein
MLNSRPEAERSEPALLTSSLYKSFRAPAGERLEVLRGVSFEAAAGEMLALTGASGAGKSTLLHLLGGLEAADAGSIKLGQVEMTTASRSSLSRLRNERVGYVFQFHHLLPDLTATENVALPLFINRLKRGESMARAASMLRDIGLSERLDHKIGLLSGGEQQRVALARALITKPRLVLADEPTGNLDAATGEEITARLAAFCREHSAAVIIATHNERVANFCDRTLVLREGKLV